MKRKILLLCTYLLFLSGYAQSQDENLWYAITDTNDYIMVDEIAFIVSADEGGLMAVAMTDGQVVAGVRSLQFLYTTTDVKPVRKESDLQVALFPNPVVTQLTIAGLREESAVAVLSLDGAVLINTTLDPETTTLNVSALSTGMYLLRVNDTVVKFIKK